jgi:amino acid adenylation domain-containing protein
MTSQNFENLGELSAEQHALLMLRLKKKARERASEVTPRVPRGERLPLSFAQERLWFIDQIEPGSVAYNIQGGVQLNGPLQVAALAQSLAALLARHAVLRTSFVEVGGEGRQEFDDTTKLEFPLIDLTGLNYNEQQQEAERLRRKEARRPFNLRQAPLLRVKLLRLAEQQHQFLFTLHHIVSDGWSLGVLVREIGSLYEAYLKGEPSALPELAIQYADFAVWQRTWLQGAVLEAELHYWRQQLAQAPEVLELPTDRGRPRVEGFRGGLQRLGLSAELSRKLRELSQQQGATLFMTLLAAFKTLLYRYSGQTDLLVGTPVANRNRVEVEPLIGFFVNTLVLRTGLSGEVSFRELMGRVREVVLEAQGHQELPFERLVQELAPERSLSHAPLFQVMMVLDNTQGRKLELPGLQVEGLASNSTTAKFDLMLALTTNGEGQLSGVIEYKQDLFDASRIARLGRHLATLLEAVADDPDQPLAQAPLLTAAERHHWLLEMNDTESECWTRCITELFEQQAQQRPDAVALVFGDQQVTYQELEARSNRLANHLRRFDVGVETRVVICVERSIEMIVGLLGILKAGAAYVPLAPDYPLERSRFMLDNSRSVILLTHNRTFERTFEIGFAQEPPVLHFNLDDQIEANIAPVDPRTVLHSGEQLACLIYTSGSTGRPKGVAVPHRAIVRLVHAANYFRHTVDEVFFQLSSLSFDAASFEIWGALLNGARLVIMDPGQPSIDELARSLKRNQVTTAFLTTALFHLVVQEQPCALAAVTQVVAGGEVISPTHVRNHLLAAETVGNSRVSCVINGYGPTEVATFASTETLTNNTPVPDNIPIGRPINNTAAYILDANLQPTPLGVYGELYLGGLGVARGYHGQSSLTAERFVPDLFSNTPGARLYRTGDIVRRLADGRMEYLGRTDHQIKLRGFRIDLGEVETALMRFPAVRQSVVLFREDTPGDKRLVAYIVPETETLEAFSVAELRSHLQTRLPDYMVPSSFVLLTELPLNPHGKADRSALPAPPEASHMQDYVAPRTATESIIAGIWREVLQVKEVSVEDNFFILGGHSLLAVQVMSRVRAACNVELPLRVLFEAGTVAALAQSVEAESRRKRAALPPLVRVPRHGTLPLSFAQERLWFLSQFEPNSAFYNIPIALRLRGPLNIAALESTLSETIRRHEALRTTFTKPGGKPEQLIGPARPVRLPVIDLLGIDAEQREAVVRKVTTEDARRPFDLALGPLVRQRLVRVGKAEHVALLAMHHIVSDGWSLGVLVREIGSLYEAYLKGEPSALPELAIQYADFAVWQRTWLQGAVLEAELHYWRQQLAQAPEVLELPTDRGRPRVEGFRGGLQRLGLSAELSRKLRELSQQQGATLFMTLLAAFKTLLYRYSGQTDLLVGTPVANRNRMGVEPLIGFFVNTLVLRTGLSGEVSFRELMGRVREVVLEAQEHQELPFERLVQELAPERSLSHAPLFQVMMVLDNTQGRKLELPPLELQPVAGNSATTKFDLTLALATGEFGMGGQIEYNRDLFGPNRMARLAGHFERILESICEDPDQKLWQVKMLSEGELIQIIVKWNGTYVDTGHPNCLPQLLEMQVEQFPDAVALSFQNEQVTYEELGRRSNQLGRWLQRLGVAPEVMVGLFVERSLEMVVGLMGTLKAGGAFLPLDPDYPADRLAYMLDDAQPQLLLTQRHLVGKLPKNGARVVCLDSDWDQIVQHDDSRIEPCVVAENPAYVIYTSGSTGRPKGVIISHRAICNHTVWMQSVLPQYSFDCQLQKTPFSFDASVWEFFTPLFVGARLVIAEPSRHQEPEYLAKTIHREGVTIVQLVPSMLRALLQKEELRRCRSLRRIFCGGELLSRDLQERLALLLDTQLINLYGPTEATIDDLYWACEVQAA